MSRFLRGLFAAAIALIPISAARATDFYQVPWGLRYNVAPSQLCVTTGGDACRAQIGSINSTNIFTPTLRSVFGASARAQTVQCNGSTDDAAAMQAALNANAGGTLYVPYTTLNCVLDSVTLTQPSPPANIVVDAGVNFIGTGSMPQLLTNTFQTITGSFLTKTFTGAAFGQTLAIEGIGTAGYTGNAVALYLGAANATTSGAVNGNYLAFNPVAISNAGVGGTGAVVNTEFDCDEFRANDYLGCVHIAGVGSFDPQYGILMDYNGSSVGLHNYTIGYIGRNFTTGIYLDATQNHATKPADTGMRIQGVPFKSLDIIGTGADANLGITFSNIKQNHISIIPSVDAAGLASLVGWNHAATVPNWAIQTDGLGFFTTLRVGSLSGILKGNGTSPVSVAVPGTDYVAGLANPTATIGLTAVNGTAASAMRSDAAPPLSQSIVPTWTGIHTFSAAPVFSLGAKYSGSSSGTVTVVAPAVAGTPTITWGNASGTPAVTASAPLALSTTTGNMTVTGAAGQVLAGSTPAFTATPTLGVAGSTVGSLAFANATSGSVTLQPVTGALGSAVLSLPAATDTLVGKATTDIFTNKDLTSGTNTFPTFNQNTTGSAAKWTTARNLAGNSVDGSANVAFSNKFIVQGTTDAGLSGAQFLGALGTGLVKNTTTTGVLSIVTEGTGVETALGVNVGTAGAFVVNGGALGTPSSGTLTSATGLPISSGVSGLGTGVATALGVNTGSAGAFAVNNAANTFSATNDFTGALQSGGVTFNGAWTAYTPTVTATSGTFTTVSAAGRSLTMGKTVFLSIQITITTNGTAAGAVRFTLPATAANAVVPYATVGRQIVGGSMVVGQIVAGSSTADIVTFNNLYPGSTGEIITVSGEYELP